MPSDLDAFLDARTDAPAPGLSPLVTTLLATLGPLAVWVAAFGLAVLVSSPDVASDQCEGIGWGCTLSPQDTALFVGVLVGLFATGTVVVAAGVVLAPTGG